MKQRAGLNDMSDEKQELEQNTQTKDCPAERCVICELTDCEIALAKRLTRLYILEQIKLGAGNIELRVAKSLKKKLIDCEKLLNR